MPNWCNNNVTISHTDPTKIEALAAAVREGKFCNFVKPVPASLHIVAGRVGDDNDPEQIKAIIEKAYFQEGLAGKIQGNQNYISLTEEMDEVAYSVLKGLHNATVKITNGDVIDGSMRFMVDESNGDLRIYPISIYCYEEDGKFCFY